MFDITRFDKYREDSRLVMENPGDVRTGKKQMRGAEYQIREIKT